MTKAIATVIAAGIVVGTIGGLAGSDLWLYVGMSVMVAGTCALYAFGLVKNPLGVVKAEMDVEAQFSGYPQYGVKPEQEQTIRTHQEGKPPVPSNSTPHPDAPRASSEDRPPSARAGERGREPS